MQDIITLYCARCKRSLKVDYIVTGDKNAAVLPNVVVRCHHCKRALMFKNYSEGKLMDNVVNGTARI